MKNRLLSNIISILILLVAVSFAVFDAVVPSFNLWVHPVLTFFFVLFLGFGIKTFVLGFIRSSAWNFFLSAILLGFAFAYGFICSFTEFWWLAIIIVGVLWAIVALLSISVNGNGTEDIALNSKPDYKVYKNRKKEDNL